MEILIVSGLSGAGKSRAAAVLEDIDYYCVDNMPAVLMPKFTELCLATRGKYERVALVSDVRGGAESFGQLFAALDEMRSMGCEYRILFVEARPEVIVKRYKETRRRHPLDPDGGNIEEALRREAELLRPMRERADVIIDTSTLTLGQLQLMLLKNFSKVSREKLLTVNLMSFGFKHGLPIEADMVFDVRFLPNPYYLPELRGKTGLDDEVRDFVFGSEQTQKFTAMLEKMMEFLLPCYMDEGKPSLVVAFGCTGGQHRSVAVAEAVSDYVESLGYPVDRIHRDMLSAGNK